MSEILTAVYQDGAFIPEQETHFAAGARVRLVVEPLSSVSSQSLDQIDAILDEASVDARGSRLTRDDFSPDRS